MKKILSLALIFVLCLGAGTAMAARSGGTLNYMAPYGGDLFGLDPHKSSRYQDHLVGMNIHRGLFKWDAAKSAPVPDIAESYKVSDGGMTWTIKLRKNVMFHHGRKMTADDVLYSFNRISSLKNPVSPQARYLRSIKGAKDVEDGKAKTIAGLEKIDDYTIKITLADPVDLTYFLWLPGVRILPKDKVEELGDKFSTNPVGCGPFKFVKWVKGSEIQLAKFDKHYEAGKPYLDKVIFKIMGEAAARDLAFKAKDLDATIVGAVHYQEYSKDPVISKNMIEVAEMFTRLVGMNPSFKPFSDKRVRQAINYAIPSDLIIKKILKGKAFPARGFLPTTSPAFDPKRKKYEFDLKKAKALMKEAGYEKGFVVEQAIGTANKSWGTGIYEAMMPFLKKIGITLKIQQMEGAAMAERIRQGEFQMFIWSLTSGPDPLEAMQRWKGDLSMSGGNYVGFKNAAYDKHLEAAAATTDPAKRIAEIKKACAIFSEEAPVWFFNYNKAIMAHHPWVHGLGKVAPEMMFQDLANVWVDEKSPRANAK
jgi:peptide/nickel transport system substrate-binding protein